MSTRKSKASRLLFRNNFLSKSERKSIALSTIAILKTMRLSFIFLFVSIFSIELWFPQLSSEVEKYVFEGAIVIYLIVVLKKYRSGQINFEQPIKQGSLLRWALYKHIDVLLAHLIALMIGISMVLSGRLLAQGIRFIFSI